MNRIAQLTGAVLIALVFAGAGYWLGQRDTPAAAPAGSAPGAPRPPAAAGGPSGPPGAGGGVAVEVARVAKTSLPQAVSAVGTIRSNESVMLRPEISGRIAEFSFGEGQGVAKGAVLVRLDASVARAELQQARANLVLSQGKFERATELQGRGFVSSQAREEAENNLKVAQAAVAVAEAKLAKTEIVAPFSGILGLRSASVGDFVKDGADIVNLEAIDPLKVDFRVPEVHFKKLRVGQSLQLSLDAFPGQTFAGRIYAINPAIDAAGRAVVLRATVQNNDGRLRPGGFARVRLLLDEQGEALMIPEQALVPTGEDQFVYKVQEGRAQRLKVDIGQRRDGRVEVVRGLNADETVVVAGQMKLRDGVPVKPLGEPAPAAAGAAPAANKSGT
ncbi:Multidrug resistance protein MdtA [Burkholderiales bacterium]|nr:Multidrug resistance protein MdtA [Burkholderiales bacterium]